MFVVTIDECENKEGPHTISDKQKQYSASRVLHKIRLRHQMTQQQISEEEEEEQEDNKHYQFVGHKLNIIARIRKHKKQSYE